MLPPFSFLLMRVFLRVVSCALPPFSFEGVEKKRKEPLKEKGSTKNQLFSFSLRNLTGRENPHQKKRKGGPTRRPVRGDTNWKEGTLWRYVAYKNQQEKGYYAQQIEDLKRVGFCKSRVFLRVSFFFA